MFPTLDIKVDKIKTESYFKRIRWKVKKWGLLPQKKIKFLAKNTIVLAIFFGKSAKNWPFWAISLCGLFISVFRVPDEKLAVHNF